MWNLVLGCPTCDAIVRQSPFSACSCTNAIIVGMVGMFATLCGVSKGRFVASRRTTTLLIASTKCMTESVSFSASIAEIGKSPLGGVVFASLLSSFKRTMAAWCLMPTRWTVSKLNLNKRGCHRLTRPKLSDRFKLHLSELRLIQIVSLLLSRSSQGSKTDEPPAKHFYHIKPSLHSALLRGQNQWQMGLKVSF